MSYAVISTTGTRHTNYTTQATINIMSFLSVFILATTALKRVLDFKCATQETAVGLLNSCHKNKNDNASNKHSMTCGAK